MKVSRIFRTAAALLIASSITACALLSRPKPLTTLQLRFPDISSQALSTAWPGTLAFESLNTATAISNNRVMVFDGAKVMQFAGLRWVDTPAVMLTEQFKTWQAQAVAEPERHRTAQLKLSLTDFSIHVNAADSNTVVVSASAELQCLSNDATHSLGIFSNAQPLQKMDAQRIAEVFSDATVATSAAVITAAKLAGTQCQQRDDGDKAASSSLQ
jgi:ABC-type uncharacterized transport system auxiliary subunit